MSACVSCGAPLPEHARFCPSCGAPVGRSAPASGERKLATVLFGDLIGSTALASERDPERVRVLLDRFYAAMAEEIERTGGTVEKFAGDAVMAVFGAPAALEDHAERALHAALAMQRRMEEEFGELGLRIGVNTGEVVVGSTREGGSFVSGDAVNVGARLEEAAARGEVLAGERTVAAARGAFEFGDPRTVEGKGKPAGIECRPVLRALTLMRPRGVGGLRRVFVGRETELELLRATFRRAVSLGDPHVVTVVGPPGVGKTRLVRELWEALAGEDSAPLRRTGRCLPYGEGITYWPLGEVLKEHFGILESDSPQEVMRRLAGRDVLGLALGLDVAGAMHPLEARDHLHEAVVRFVEELSAERPLAMLVEDVHWAEDDLLDLLERIVREARGRILMIATARPELVDRRPALGTAGRNSATIWLEPLPAEDTSRLLDDLLGQELPEPLRELLVDRSEGNPFFVEELLGALLDDGVLERVGGQLRVHEVPAEFSIPDSVQAVLAARLDRLPAIEKTALQAASVVGRAFWAGPVAHLLDGVEPDFDLLEERDFVRRGGGSSMAGEREYGFKHALTREVAYASLPKARRGRLHAALADWLERADRARDEHAALLAYHYSEAVRPEDADLVWGDDRDEHARLRGHAVVWLRRAGRLARSRYELDEAVSLLTRAASLTVDEHERAVVWREIGEVQALRYDGDAMRAALLRALEGPLDDSERADTYAFLAFQASIRSAMWSIRLNREFIEDWAARALELAGEGTEARARALLARVNIEPSEAPSELVREAAAAAEACDDPGLSSYAMGARSQAAFESRRFHEAADWTSRRLELLPAITDPDHLCEGYESALPVMIAVERFEEARRFAELHWGLARRLSAHHRVHAVSLPIELADALGDWDAVAAATDRVTDAVAANVATPCVRNPRDLLLCAVAHLCRGDEERASALERDGDRIAGSGYESYLAAPRLRLALERGDRGAVQSLLELPIERSFVWGPAVYAVRLDALVALGARGAIEREAPELVAPGTLVEPFALRALGAARGDDDLLERAQERFVELHLEWHAAQTARLLAWPG